MPRHVLIVEDDPDTAEALADLLALEGFTATTTTSLSAALASLSERVPDIAIVDLILNDGDGFAFARELRRRLGATVRLVACSGRRPTGDEVESAFDAYLYKPIGVEDLLAACGE